MSAKPIRTTLTAGLLAGAIACCPPLAGGQDAESPRPETGAADRPLPSPVDYLRRAEAEIDVGLAALLFERELIEHMDIHAALAEIDGMAAELRLLLDGITEPVERVATINKYLFEDRGLAYAADRHFLSDVIVDGHGDCVGFTCLYLALGHRLELPLAAVHAPRHVFVRYPVGNRMLNIETTSGGAFFKQKDLVRRLDIHTSAIGAGAYLRPLHKTELLSILVCNRGKAYLRVRRIEEARRDFDLAMSLYPLNPAAYNNRGVLMVLDDRPVDAMIDFDRALLLDPGNGPAYANRAGDPGREPCFAAWNSYVRLPGMVYA